MSIRAALLPAFEGRVWPYWCAIRVGAWLCGLPFRLRRRTLPALLQHLTPKEIQHGSQNSSQLESAVRICVWLCQRWPFRLSLFPRACLRQALTLYYTVTRLGFPVEIHFGVHKVEEELRGHSWVTLDGVPLGERGPIEQYRVTYSYPSGISDSTSTRRDSVVGNCSFIPS